MGKENGDPFLDWGEPIWSGEPPPSIFEERGRRRLMTCYWGLPEDLFAELVAAMQRGALFARSGGFKPAPARAQGRKQCHRVNKLSVSLTA